MCVPLVATLVSSSSAQPAQFTHQVTDGVQTFQAHFELFDNRSPNFRVLVQQGDGSFAEHTAPPLAAYIGSVQGAPGASANALVRAGGQVYYHVLFEDGTEWRSEDGAATVLSSPLTAPSWPHLVPSTGGAGSDIDAAEVGVDLTFDRLNGTHNGDVDAALEMIEHSIMSANMVYLRDTGLIHRTGRVIIRGSQAMDPYAGLTDHGPFLDTLIQQWENVLPASTHDLALVVRTTGGAGLAGVGIIGNPPGYSSNDATDRGDFSRPWRHEAGHNWSLLHFDGGAPEGSTVNSGNSLSSFSGPEQALVTTFRDGQSAFLDNLGPFNIALPPQAATDNLYLPASSASTLVDILGNDHDANGDTLELVAIDATSDGSLGGTMSIEKGAGPGGRDAVRYVPPTLPGPTSSIDRFKYRIRDASGREAIGYVFVRMVDFTAQFAQDFSGLADGSTVLNDGSFISDVEEGSVASVLGEALQLTPDELGRQSAYTLPLTNLTGGYVAEFRFLMDAQGTPADILALNFGDPIPAFNNLNDSRFNRGLTLEFVTFPSQVYRIQVDGFPVPQGSIQANGLVDGQWHTVVAEWQPRPSPMDGAITVTVDGVRVFDGLGTPGFVPQTSEMLAFTARTGGLSQRVLVDDVTAARTSSGTSTAADEPISTFALEQNYPNPFSASTTIGFSLADPGPVRVTVYDLVGRQVATLADRIMSVGTHHVTWNARTGDFADGVYYYRLQTATGQKVRTLVLMGDAGPR
ncbi:MAG: hypothetical protein ACI80V_003642 [Rhodothermales bacterium]|jgi:hypothetical protein